MFMIDDAWNVQLPIQIWGHSLHQYTGKMLTSTVSLKNRSGETKQASYVPLEPSHKSFFTLDVSRWFAAAHLFAAPTIWLQRRNMGRKRRKSLVGGCFNANLKVSPFLVGILVIHLRKIQPFANVTSNSELHHLPSRMFPTPIGTDSPPAKGLFWSTWGLLQDSDLVVLGKSLRQLQQLQ